MNLQDIKAFVAVAETGSINRAALRLNLTQPATTRRVQNFEAALGGAALLDRSAKPSVLTPAGHQALAHCRRVLKAVAELEASASAAGEPSGDFRIGIAHGLAEIVLTSPLGAVRRRFAGLRLQVSSDWTTRLIDQVRAGSLDCALALMTADHAVPANLRAVPLGPERVVVVAKRDAGRQPKPKRLRDLAAARWVLNPAGCGCRAALQRALDGARQPMDLMAEILGEDLQLALLARGGGYGLVPRRQLEHSPHRAQLRIVELDDFKLPVTIALLHGAALGNLAPVVDLLRAKIAGRLGRS